MENNSAHNVDNVRPLSVDFDLHTDGDMDFKKELAGLMIDDIWELNHAQHDSQETFYKACHKIKATLEILNDKDLNEVISQLRSPESDIAKQQEAIHMFDTLCEELVKSLTREAA